MNYIMREDNIPVMTDNSAEELLAEKLQKEYAYIYNSMQVEKYDIRFNNFDIFTEILFVGKVVGFASYSLHMLNNLALNEIYILPDFRKNRLFLQEIMRFSMFGTSLSITEPTRNLVEILIHYNLAVKLNDSLVASAFTFDIADEHLIYHGDFDIGEVICSVNLYDLNLCSPLYLQDISTQGVCNICYQKVQDEDDRVYNCGKFRNSLDFDEYFLKFKNDFLNNGEKYTSLLMDLKSNLPSNNYNSETILGDGDGLSDYMWSLIDEGILDESEALKLTQQLKKDYEDGIVADEGLLTRMFYLMNGADLREDTDLFLDNISRTGELCPYCYQQVNRSDSFCRICGCNISDGSLLDYDNVISEITRNDDNVLDLRGDKFDDFMNDILKEEDDEIITATDELNAKLVEIYKNNDEEGFKKLIEEYPIEITEISEIAGFEDRLVVDLSSCFSGCDADYLKNYYVSCLLIDMDKPVKKHALNENTERSYPSYNIHWILKELNENPNIDDAFKNADITMDEDSLKKLIFTHGLAESRQFGDDFWVMVYNNYKVAELKEILRNNGLKVSGNKMDLTRRVEENCLYAEFDENEFKLTRKGEELLKGTQWVELYDKYMDYFDLDDFEGYMMKNKTCSFIQNAINYLDEHQKIGSRNNDFHRLHDAFSAKALIYIHNEEFKKALMAELQLYILRMNPIYLTSDEMKSYEPLIFSNIGNINILSYLANISNLKKTFSNAWKQMQLNPMLISKKMCLRYLNRVLDGEDLDDVSSEIANKYFSK